MAKKTISDLDKEIAKLLEKKKQMEETLALNIGKYLIKSWDVSDLEFEKICEMIDEKKSVCKEPVATAGNNSKSVTPQNSRIAE